MPCMLQRLREGEMPQEETSQKTYKLLHMGFPQGVIGQGIAMLGECPWTTKLVEQPHSSTKALMSAHSMYGADIMEACAPYQYALSTRSGMDCVAHALRAATHLDPTLTVISIDGVGAFDHIRRQSMLSNFCREAAL